MKLADKIILSMMRELRNKNHRFVLPSFYLGNWECDIYSLLRSGYSEEYEIKISVPDYKKDFEKEYIGHNWEKKNKHQLIQKGLRTNRFYFIVPEGLIDVKDVPDYAGLIYATEKQDSRFHSASFRYIKTAKIIHKNKAELQNSLELRIAEKCYWRYIHLLHDFNQTKPFRN